MFLLERERYTEHQFNQTGTNTVFINKELENCELSFYFFIFKKIILKWLIFIIECFNVKIF